MPQLTFGELVDLLLDGEHPRRVLPGLSWLLLVLLELSLLLISRLATLTKLILTVLRSCATHPSLIRHLVPLIALLLFLLILHGERASKLRIKV